MRYTPKSGTITLYSLRNGHMLVKKRYSTIWGRRKIIDDWRVFYKDNFGKYYYQISPDLVTVREKELV